ncbi:hypothetical protein TIFTF001_026522 [Ficus carica]|uniref:Uncharacterized protein n=1 Tax=Ficus carica TaxID=3494 RepID=A0AA88DLC4_FICCA|nr:hypothetical protein TIFTF001_026522 [Ficus carica]
MSYLQGKPSITLEISTADLATPAGTAPIARARYSSDRKIGGGSGSGADARLEVNSVVVAALLPAPIAKLDADSVPAPIVRLEADPMSQRRLLSGADLKAGGGFDRRDGGFLPARRRWFKPKGERERGMGFV